MGDINIFHHFKSHPSHSLVQIADGSLSDVTKIRSIKLSNDLLLSSIGYVHGLSCNLMPTSKLTSDLNCLSKFYSNLCRSQELGSIKVIGIAKKEGGLYLFQEKHLPSSSFNPKCQSSSNSVSFILKSSRSRSLSCENKVMLCTIILVIQSILKSWFLIYLSFKSRVIFSAKFAYSPNIPKILIQVCSTNLQSLLH